MYPIWGKYGLPSQLIHNCRWKFVHRNNICIRLLLQMGRNPVRPRACTCETPPKAKERHSHKFRWGHMHLYNVKYLFIKMSRSTLHLCYIVGELSLDVNGKTLAVPWRLSLDQSVVYSSNPRSLMVWQWALLGSFHQYPEVSRQQL